jgi:hypothetical protein
VNIQDLQAEINAIDQETAQLENNGEQALFKKPEHYRTVSQLK